MAVTVPFCFFPPLPTHLLLPWRRKNSEVHLQFIHEGKNSSEGGASDDGEKLERMRLDRNSTAAEARRREKGRKEKREREAAKERTLAVSSVGIRPKRRRERREREREGKRLAALPPKKRRRYKRLL